MDLYTEFYKFVRMVARETLYDHPASYDWSDANQAAYVALLETAETFDGDPLGDDRHHFLNSVRIAVRAAIRTDIGALGYPVSGPRNALHKDRETWPTGVPFDADAMPAAVPFSELPDEDKLSLEAIYESLDILTDRQREVIGLYYLDGLLSDTLVADRLGIHKSSAMRARERAEKALQEALK